MSYFRSLTASLDQSPLSQHTHHSSDVIITKLIYRNVIQILSVVNDVLSGKVKASIPKYYLRALSSYLSKIKVKTLSCGCFYIVQQDIQDLFELSTINSINPEVITEKRLMHEFSTRIENVPYRSAKNMIVKGLVYIWLHLNTLVREYHNNQWYYQFTRTGVLTPEVREKQNEKIDAIEGLISNAAYNIREIPIPQHIIESMIAGMAISIIPSKHALDEKKHTLNTDSLVHESIFKSVFDTKSQLVSEIITMMYFAFDMMSINQDSANSDARKSLLPSNIQRLLDVHFTVSKKGWSTRICMYINYHKLNLAYRKLQGVSQDLISGIDMGDKTTNFLKVVFTLPEEPSKFTAWTTFLITCFPASRHEYMDTRQGKKLYY